jgi:uncharacterized protein YkwD
VGLAPRAFFAALAAVTMLLALSPALGSAHRPGARAAATDVMVQKINQVRARYGMRPLRGSATLTGESQQYAAMLMRADVLRHSSLSRAAGRSGEVLAMHFGRNPRPRSTVAKWMRSPGHRAVLLSGSMRAIGAGYAQGHFGRGRAVIWVARVAG